RNRNITINDGDTFLGLVQLPGTGPFNQLTETKITGTHVELMAYAPVCPRYDIDLFASGGIVRNKLSLRDTFISVDNVPFEPPLVRTYDVKHTHARFSFGAQKTFCNHFGIRALIGWENTSRFKNLKPLEVPDSDTNVKAKNSIIYSIGVFAIA